MSMRAFAGLYLPRRASAPQAATQQADPAADALVRRMLAGITPQPADQIITRPGLILGTAPFEGQRPEPPRARPETPVLLIGDLRLDNAAALASELGLSRVSDHQAIAAAAWQRWRYDLPLHLEGGFALACWDEQERTLFLVRDHAGERPLHVQSAFDREGTFAFASMPQQLCELPGIGCHVDLERLAELQAGVDLDSPRTCFRHLERLPPAHWLKVSASGIERRAYWHPLQSRPIRYARDSEYIDDLRERLDRATAVLVEGTDGVGCELSGGLDSSSVMATAATALARERRGLTAFTAVPVPGFDGGALPGRCADEGPAAAAAAALYPNVTHVLVDSSDRDLLEVCGRVARLRGEPPTSPVHELWLTAILDGMRTRGLGVLLTGYAGNYTISFGGLVALSGLFRRLRWIELLRRTRELRAGGFTSWRGAARWAAGGVLPAPLRASVHPELGDFRMDASPIRPERMSELRVRDRALDSALAQESSVEAMRRALYDGFDVGASSGAAAAGWGISQRDPMQAKSLYEFCYGIPIEQFLAGGQTRSLVRRAMAGRLPESTLRQTVRGMQSADWYLIVGAQRERLRAELRRVANSPQVQHWIDLPRLNRLLDTWPASGYHDHAVFESYNLALTRGVTAAGFIAAHDPEMPREIDAPPETARPGAGPGLTETQRA